MAPLALKINEEILNERNTLLRLERHFKQTGTLSESEQKKLETFALKYDYFTRTKGAERITNQIKNLKQRIDSVPPSILIAAAAMESNWGTSRVAIEANSLYKEKVWYTDEGLEPLENKDDGYRFKIFPSLLEGMRNFARTFNSNINYRSAWMARDGFADRHGHPLGRQTFLLAGDFYEGRAAVLTETGWGLLRRDGTYALPPDREQLEWYGPDNVATAARDGLWHLFDRCGRQLTETGADWMGEPSEGRILFRRGSRFGFIGLDGRPVTPLRFDEAYSFRNGQAWVRIQGDSFRIDPDGHRIG